MLEAIEGLLLEERPDWVLVYGDTNSTLAGALAAVKLHIPVAHVEAGLRSFNRRMPEEINRVLTDHAAERLYCPTEIAVANLRREGIPGDRIALVGDVMFDAALFYGEVAAARSRILEEAGIAPGGYVLATIHRAENTDDRARLESIFRALDRVAEEVPVIMPLHPRTKAALEKARLKELATRTIHLIDPVGYLDMIMLERNAKVIATDSGGVQKEAYFYGVPCVTLRDETEWVELVDSGWNLLAPPEDPDLLAHRVLGAAAPESRGPRGLYGDGQAARAITRSLLGQ
jgi:UDP-GlcNAc3NAcA epimerase